MLKNSNVFNGNIVNGKINNKIDTDTLSQLNMGYSSDGKMTSGYSSAIEKLAVSYNEATAEANALKMAQDGLSESTVRDILAKQSWSKAEMDAAISSTAFKDAQTKATITTASNTSATWANVVATKALSVVKKAASAISGVLFAGAISIGISALVKLANGWNKSAKEIKQAAETSKQAIDDIKSSFESLKNTTDGIKERYAELAQGIDQISGKNVKLSDDEYKEFLDLSNQLSELFPSLTKNYDENGNAIVGLTGNINSIVSSLDALIKKEQETANQKILEEMPDVYAGLANSVSEYNKQLNEYKLIKDSMPTDVEIDLRGRASFELNDDYYIDKDTIKYIKDKFKEKFEEYELDNATANTTYSVDGELQFNITGLENTEEYREKISQIYDEIKVELIKKTQEINSSIETEMNGFDEYIYTWLSFDPDYAKIDNDGLKTAIQELLFNSNWIDDLPENMDSTKWSEELEGWLKTNYLDAINNIDNKEYKQKLLDLFTLDLNPQEQIKIAQELQDYFDQNNIKISLDFILDGENQNSAQNLVDRMSNSIGAIAGDDTRSDNELKKFTNGFSKEQMNIWLTVTDGITNAGDAIREYNNAVSNMPEPEVEFFTEGNTEKIDEYKNKISNLGTYLQSINEKHELSADEMSVLNIEYGIVAGSVEEYKQKIIELMNESATSSEIMTTLVEAINSCANEEDKARLQSLYNTLSNLNTEAQNNADSFAKFETAVSSLQGKADLLRDVDQGIKDVGYIDSSKLDDIISRYPKLTTKVAEYNQGLITSSELFDSLKIAYEKDAKNYKIAMAYKLQDNEDFYDDVEENIPQWLKDQAKSYGIDFNNYKTLCETKLALDKEYARKKALVESTKNKSDYLIQMNEKTHTQDTNKGTQLRDQVDSLSAYDDYLDAQSELEEYEKFLEGFDTTLSTTISFDTSWEGYGKDNDKDENPDEKIELTEIDWADQSLSVLQDKVDKFQDKLENTHGLESQIRAIDKLNKALKKLKGGYQKAYDEYEDRYEDALEKSGNDPEIKFKIESGEEFDLGSYDSETAKYIQEAIDNYNKMLETKQKIKDTTEQINKNEKEEKVHVRLDNYEAQADLISSMLADESLTAKEKNKLLEREKEIKNSILQQNILLAETEEERLKLQEDYNNYLQENEKSQYENNRDGINSRISYYDSRVKDIQNAIALQEAKGGQGTAEQYEEMNGFLDKQIAFEKKNFNNAKAMRDQAAWGSTEYEFYNDQIQEAQDNINACKIAQIENNKAIKLLPVKYYEDLNEQLEKELELVTKTREEIENAIGYASTLIQDQIDMLNDSKENIIDHYDEEIKKVQEKKDALTESNDEIQRNIDLENAKYNLEKAMRNKTSRVYRKNEGFVWETDQDSIIEAQNELDSQVYDNQIADLDKKINDFNKEKDSVVEIIDEEIKAWEKYAEKIEKVNSSYDKFLALQDFINNFGGDATDKILAQDNSIIYDFGVALTNIKVEENELNEQIEANNLAIQAIQAEAEAYISGSAKVVEARQAIDAIVNANQDEIDAMLGRTNAASTYGATWTETKQNVTTALSEIEIANTTAIENEKILLDVRTENLKLFKDTATGYYNEIITALDNIELSNIEAKDNELIVLDERKENLKTFKNAAVSYYNKIASAVSSAQSSFAKLQSILESTKSTYADIVAYENKINSANAKNNGKNKGKNNQVYAFQSDLVDIYHDGGVVGKGSNLPNNLIALTNDTLKPNEVLAKLLKNEVVLNQPQMGNLFSNLGNTYSALVPQNLNNNSNDISITIGDIKVYNPNNSDVIVDEIVKELPLKVVQRLNSKK